jgi:hypothetical protein
MVQSRERDNIRAKTCGEVELSLANVAAKPLEVNTYKLNNTQSHVTIAFQVAQPE